MWTVPELLFSVAFLAGLVAGIIGQQLINARITRLAKKVTAMENTVLSAKMDVKEAAQMAGEKVVQDAKDAKVVVVQEADEVAKNLS